MADPQDKIIALIDMDCFFCQVEEREHPELLGKPLVVTQYNLILAVNYEAKDAGIKRFIRPDQAKEQYPELNIVSVPIQRGKGDVSKYRSAGQEVIEVLKQHCPLIERASVDEAYLDITNLVNKKMEVMSCSSKDLVSFLKNTFVVGYCDDDNNEERRQNGLEQWIKEAFDDLGDIQARKLALAGLIVEEFRAEVFEKCKFKCSAGISYNKALAKLACGIHKPNKQTILSSASVPELFLTLPINRVRNLGGKIGKELVESLGCNVMTDLLRFSLQDLQKHFDEKTGLRLFNIARGVDNEMITPRLISKSIGASKNFSIKAAITDLDNLKQWINDLTEDVVDRLQQDSEENHRRATTLVISHQYVQDNKTISHSRTFPLAAYKTNRIIKQALDVISKFTDKPIVGVSIAASKFVDIGKNGNFVNYFKPKNESQDRINQSQATEINDSHSIHIENTSEEPESSTRAFDVLKPENKEASTTNSPNISQYFITSRDKNQGKEESNKGLSERRLSQLQEIFPQLDNIDPSVLALLPIELQNEAEIYLKSKNGTNMASVKEEKKVLKERDKHKNNGIQKFFVKNVSECSQSTTRCSECNQLIQKDKYSEHVDFHVAENLQRNLNQSLNQSGHDVKRNREGGSTPKTNKKKKGIESYFCSNK